MAEPWIVIKGYDGLYLVNDEGQVWSQRAGRLLKPGIASNGYPTVALGRGNTRTLHSLVADAFLGPRPPGKEVRHKDGVRTNPRLSNLEYGTRRENIYDSIRHQQWTSERRQAAWKAQKKLTADQLKLLQQSLGHLSNRALGRQLGITHATVARYAAELGGRDG